MVWWLRDGFALLLILSYSGCADSNTPGPKKDAAIDSRESAPSKADSGSPPAEHPPDTADRTGFSRCIEDWPTSGGPHPLRPSLNVNAPKVLWRRTVAGFKTGWSYDAGPVLAKDRVAFHVGTWVYFVNKDGSSPQTVSVRGCPSGLVADEQGNVYFTSPGAVTSLDSTGKQRWSYATTWPSSQPGGSDNGSGCMYSRAPVLAPDGTLYAVSPDQMVRAFATSDGRVLWSRSAPNGSTRGSQVMGGGGKAVFVAFGDTHTDALDVRDGTSLGAFVRASYGLSFVWNWGSWIQGWDLGVGCDLLYVYDTCGRQTSVNITEASRSGVLASGELVVMSKEPTAAGDWTKLALYSSAGQIVSGAAPGEGIPIAAGADGTIYTYASGGGGTIPAFNRIVAYSPELKELWRIELTANRPLGLTGNVVLDDDGALYLTRPSEDSETEILAIQTRSPGLADSSWPSFRHDNRGTAWLVPGTPANINPPDAAPSDAIDAPVGVDTRD